MCKAYSAIIKLILTGIMSWILFPATLSAYIINGSTVTLTASDRTSDNTWLIQSFLNNAAYTKIIIQPGTNNISWPVNPLFFSHNNTEIHLDANTVLEAKPGGYTGGGSVINTPYNLVGGFSNIKVTGDGSATSKILMHKEEYALLPASESRMAVLIYGCQNVTISGLTLENAGGDGILLGAVVNNGQWSGYCSNVIITDVVTDGCARNGLAVISVDGLTVTGCTFKNTHGQGNCAANGPWAGIDLEPDNSSMRLANISINNCTFLNNGQYGLSLYAPLINGSSGVMSATIANCTMDGNGVSGIVVSCIPDSVSDSSNIVFTNCIVSNNLGVGVWIDSKSKFGGTLSFTDCFLWNNCINNSCNVLCDVPLASDTAILIKNHFTPNTASGNIQLNNVVVVQPTNRIVNYCLSMDATCGSISNVSGTVQPFGGTVFATGNTADINVTQRGFAVGKLSNASSSFDSSCPASKVNDGIYCKNNVDNFWGCAVGQDVNAWWSVDLGQTLPLGKVRINYRKFVSGSYHFVPLSVTVQTSNDNSNWTTVINKSANVPQEGSTAGEALYEYPIGENARYVRLLFEDGGSSYSGYKLIELAEVEITPCSFAANKTSSASSTFGSSYSASKANDGVYFANDAYNDNLWGCENDQDVGAWWSVDLGQTLDLGKVRVQYRKIGGNYHFVPLSVTVQISNDNSNWTTVVSKSANIPQEGAQYSDILYEYPIGANARFVRLLFEDGGNTYSGYKLIELVEVEIIPLGLAANKTSSASSTFGSSYSASKANDGVYFANDAYNDNLWGCENNQDVGAWWSVDLGQTLDLGKVRVQYRKIGGNYHFVPLSVTVQISSDNSNWTTVVSKSANVPQEGAQGNNVLYEYPIGGNARYARLLFEDGGSSYSGYKLIELVEVEITPLSE